MLDVRVQRARGFDLLGGQARRAVRALALEHLRIETARGRILDDAVFHSVLQIARLHHRCVDGRVFLRRNVAAGRAVHESMQHHAHGVHARSDVRWRTRDDRVEVCRVHRRQRQSLIAARGAAVPQRCGRLFTVIRADDSFCVNRQLMQRSMRVVDKLFRMPDRERGAGRRVAAVRARRRVAERDGGCERLVADRAGPPAVADGLQFAVPTGCRQPHFYLDVRIGRRLARQRDTAERRRCRHRASERWGQRRVLAQRSEA